MSVPIDSELIEPGAGSGGPPARAPVRPVAERAFSERILSARQWLLPAGFLLLQLVAVLFVDKGAFTDEGIYVLAGTEPLLGRDDDVAYQLWLDGSPYLFPLLSGVAFSAAGLAGSRMLAAALWAAGLVFFSRFVEGRFGPAAAWWATLLLCVNGAFFSVAHLAVYDSLAFLAVSACLWSAQQVVLRRRIEWVGRVSFWAALAAVTKYSAVVLLLLAIPVTLVSSKGRNGRALVACVIGAAALGTAYLGLFHGEIFPRGALAILLSHPLYASRSEIAFRAASLLLLPLALAVVAALRLEGARARLAWVLVGCGVAWPLLHVLSVQSVSLSKHVASSFVFLYPLAGFLMADWWQKRQALAGVIFIAATLWGGVQFLVLDHSWVDMRPVAEFLVPRLHRHDRVGSESGWDLAMYAVQNGASTGPGLFPNDWHLRGGQDPCKLSWIVGTRPADEAPSPRAQQPSSKDYAAAAERCGFEPVARFASARYQFAPPLIRRFDEQVILYKNPGLERLRLSQ